MKTFASVAILGALVALAGCSQPAETTPDPEPVAPAAEPAPAPVATATEPAPTDTAAVPMGDDASAAADGDRGGNDGGRRVDP